MKLSLRTLSRKLSDVWKRWTTSKKTFEEKVQDTYKNLDRHLRAGDILFFLGKQDAKWYDKLLMFFSPLPVVHVGFVRKKKTRMLLHSTMKSYRTQRNGVHEVDLQQEIVQRWPQATILVTRLKGDVTDFAKVFYKADQIKLEKIRYSFIDAFCSLFQMGVDLDDHFNCWDFVNTCFEAHPYYKSVRNSGIPYNILRENSLELIYIYKV